MLEVATLMTLVGGSLGLFSKAIGKWLEKTFPTARAWSPSREERARSTLEGIIDITIDGRKVRFSADALSTQTRRELADNIGNPDGQAH